MVRRTRLVAVLTLAMIAVFTLVAGHHRGADALPPRLGALKIPAVASRAGQRPGHRAGPPGKRARRAGRTASGLGSALAGPLSAAALGPRVVGGGRRPGYRADAVVAETRTKPSTPALDDPSSSPFRPAALAAARPGRQRSPPGVGARHPRRNQVVLVRRR